MAERIKFTGEQLDKIKDSDEFKKFQETGAGEEFAITLDAYLANEENYSFWAEKFAEEDKPEEENISDLQDVEKIENDIASHLGAMYVETHPDENVSSETWDTKEYKKWENDYLDSNFKSGEDKELARLFDELEKAQQVRAEKLEQERLDNIEKAENDLERYLGSMYVETHPDENVTSETWDSEEYKNWREEYLKNTEDKELQSLLNAVEKVKNTEKGKNSENDKERTVLKEFEPHEVDEKTAARLAEFERMRDGLDDNENNAGGKILDITEKTEDKDNEKTLDVNEIDENGGKTTEHDEKILSDKERRIRSANSDDNAEKFNLIILDTLHEMDVISDAELSNGQNSVEDAAVLALRADMLDNRKRSEFEIRFANKIADNKAVLEYAPPSILAMSHDALKNFIDQTKKKSSNANVSAFETRLNTINERIDTLSEALAKENYLHFSDKTNIADTAQGYMELFSTRYKDLDPSDARINTMLNNLKQLDKIVTEYDDMWNLTGLTEQDADRVSERYDDAQKLVPNLQLSDDTLKLVSNFRFLDDQGNPIPQFIDPKDGSKHLTWNKGLEIDKDGRLAEAVKRTANDEVLKTIGGKDPITKDSLEQGLNDNLPIKLFTLHNAEEILKGVASEEEKHKFTDPKYAQQFIKDLNNPEKPMSLSDDGFKTAMKWEMNQVDGYVHRLNKKIAPNGVSQAAIKIYADNANIDQFAKARVAKESLPEFRLRMGKQLVKTGLNSFGMAAAFTVATKAVGTKFGATAATMTGVSVALGTTAYMVYKRKKQAKKNGQKYGWKEFGKDHALHVAVATSACAGAAAFCSMTGQPELASTFGTAAIVIGSGGKALDGYMQARKAGASQLESIAWGGAAALVTYGGAAMGRMAGNAAVEAINRTFADNSIFQTKHSHSVDIIEQEVVYKEGVVEGAKNILNHWYGDNPELLQQHVDAINQYNADHGTNIDPHRYLLASHDAGALAPTNTVNHVQGGADVQTHGNHKVFGAEWSNTTGVSAETVNHLAGSVSPNGINITPESIQAFEQIDNYISANNQVGNVPSNPYQNDGVLGFNATHSADGSTVADPKGNQYTTYADHNGVQEVRETVTTVTRSSVIENDGVTAIWGTITKTAGMKGLKKRLGALADKIMGKKQEEKAIGKDDKPVGALPPTDNKSLKDEKDKPNGITPPTDDKGITPPISVVEKDPSKFNLGAVNGDNVGGMGYEVRGHEFANLDGENTDSAKPQSQEIIPDTSRRLEHSFKEAAPKSDNEEVKNGKWKNIPLAKSFKKVKDAVVNKVHTMKEEKAAKNAEKAAQREKEQRQKERDERRAAGRREATPAAEFIGIDGSEMPNFQPKENSAPSKTENKTSEQKPQKLTQEQIAQNLYNNIDRLS